MKSTTTRWAARLLVTVLATALAGSTGVVAADAATNVMISGTVTDANGAPVAGVEVWPNDTYMNLFTDAQGHFAFPVPSGNYLALQVRQPFGPSSSNSGLTYKSNYFTPTTNQDLGQVVLPATESATVRVVDTNGAPVYGAGVARDSYTQYLGADWVDQGHHLTDTLTVEQAAYYYEGRTPDIGLVEVTHPRYTHGGPPTDLVAKVRTKAGLLYTASMADAPGSGTPADPFTMVIDGYTISPPDLSELLVSAYATDAAAVVTWSGYLAEYGAAVTGFAVTASPGGATVNVGVDPGPVAVPGLSNGTTYTFTVTAHSRAGGGTAAAAPVTPTGKPSAPGLVSATLINPTTMTVTWAKPADGGSPLMQYVVEVFPSLGDPRRMVAPDQTSTTYTVQPGVTYTIAVQAINAVGYSASATTTLTTPAAPPATTTPPPLTTTSVPLPPTTILSTFPAQVAKPTLRVKGHKITVTWAAPNAASGIVSKYLVDINPGGAKTTPGSTRRAVFKNLKPGVYKIVVTAANGVGKSKPSRTARVRIT